MINGNFNEYPLSGELLKAICMLNFISPTKVQEQVIQRYWHKRIMSQTGSGKTAAFAIPICELVDWEQ